MLIQDFLSRVQEKYDTGDATEHSYRSALEFLFENIDGELKALNEPKRVKCGAPDFIINRGEIAIGHCEAKDIDLDINPKSMNSANKAQFERYRRALPNLVYTNCLDFRFYKQGELVRDLSVADYVMGIQPRPENFEALENQLKEFAAERPQTITSSRRLAEMMAGKAVLIKDVLSNALKEDKTLNTELSGQYKAFQEHLIHDITPNDFSDIYAETIAYGMFAARLHDETLEDFSRQEALDLLPKSNPFLRSLFSYIAGPNLDERISWIIDDLADVFQACDVRELLKDFGKLTQRNDPFLHFYETFLKEYNPAKRKARGVWYTPEPIVNFIVRAVDDVLKTEFHLPLGIADTSKVTIDWDTGQKDKKGKALTTKKELHRVQILDPATGTGTFLAEVIKQIAPKVKAQAEGMWSGYIEQDLIPRIHGFELLMASYAMCHMKLDMILSELGYEPSGAPPRLGVYLTNSLEEGEPANQTLPFAQWLSNEVKQANAIKRDMPIMVIVGNPPYSGESANKSDWIMELMDAYKKEPGSVQKLQEKNSKWINDDYVKFIRFSEHMIEKNGEGVLGFITNHGYLGNPTFRGMRWHLLKTFDKIYVLDLHGNSKKKEVSPDGSADKNVFDIQQGVAIVIAVKTTPTIKIDKRKKDQEIPLARVFHADSWGVRAAKYKALWDGSIGSGTWQELQNQEPYFLFEPWDYGREAVYAEGFSISSMFEIGGTGIVTKRDGLTIHSTSDEVWQAVTDMLGLPESEVRSKYNLPEDVRDWRYNWAVQDLAENPSQDKIKPILYRPFETKKIYYTGNARGFVGWPVEQVMRHLLVGENIALLTPKITADAYSPLVSKNPVSNKSASRYDQTYCFPLYIYPSETELEQTRRVNFDPTIYEKVRIAAEHSEHGAPHELAVFDYIYGVLHCPAYRETYKEFLKIDFPRIPYPPSPEIFWDVSEKGQQLRRLHLLEPEVVGETPYPFKGEGDNVVEKVERSDNGRVLINENQYFEDVPENIWEFYIGGYRPAFKWLNDRKKRTLSFEDILHYQKIIKILSETDRIMKTIDMPLGV